MITFSNLGNPLYGRLGNQLFQIAGTIGIAKRNDTDFIFPDWSYRKYFRNCLPYGILSSCATYKQKTLNYYDIKLDKGNWDLVGFFQSERFFKNAEDTVRYYLQPAKQYEDYIDNKYGKLLEGSTCSIHIRRGDYVKQKYYFPPQPITFYKEAITQFDTLTKFVIFSDDINWCKEQFKGGQFHFIEGEEDVIDMFIMSRCNHHIISNSSFSWWGAWSNNSPHKRVICPETWFGPAASLNYKNFSSDIFSENFEKLKLKESQMSAIFKPVKYSLIYFYCLLNNSIKTFGRYILKKAGI